jgi:hypothetical protein
MDTLTIEARVASLERQNRSLKRAFLALLVAGGLAVAGVAAAAGSHSIEAGEFVVKDAQGRTRAVLGAGTLVLYGTDGKVTGSLGTGATVVPVER